MNQRIRNKKKKLLSQKIVKELMQNREFAVINDLVREKKILITFVNPEANVKIDYSNQLPEVVINSAIEPLEFF